MISGRQIVYIIALLLFMYFTCLPRGGNTFGIICTFFGPFYLTIKKQLRKFALKYKATEK